MARMIGGPSNYLQEKRLWNKWISVDWMLGMFLAYVVYAIVNHIYRTDKYIPTVLGILMLYVYKFFNRNAWKYLYTAANFRQGLDGEAIVANELEKLPDDYLVIQDVKIPGMKTNIDFVVLGANGIFAIEVKSHNGEITYDGTQLLRNGYRPEKNFLWQSRAEATALTEYLQSNVERNLYANPILVFSNKNAWMKFGKTPLNGVLVIKVDWLRELITKNNAHIPMPIQFIDQIVTLLSPRGPHGDLG